MASIAGRLRRSTTHNEELDESSLPAPASTLTRYSQPIQHRCEEQRKETVVDLVSVMNRGSAVVRENNEANHLRRWAETLVSAASTYEGFGVVAASPQAERVLGAAMMLAPTMHGDSNGPSIVFDVNFASGTLLARAARRLRDRGNQSSLVGIVLNPLLDAGTEIRIAELDYVHVEPKRAPLRQEAKCGVDRVTVLAP